MNIDGTKLLFVEKEYCKQVSYSIKPHLIR